MGRRGRGASISFPSASRSRRQCCFASSTNFLIHFASSKSFLFSSSTSSRRFLLSSISESSLRESFEKSLRWVLLSVPVWMASVSSGSFRLSPLLSYQVHRSKGLEAVGRLPAARPLRRVGSAALGFLLRLVFIMMIIKECVQQMWFMTMTIETEHI